MKTDKENPILKSSLSTLVQRFQKTDIISTLKEEYRVATPSQIHINNIDDNKILAKARINENKLKLVMDEIKEKGITSPLFIYQHKDRYQVLYPRITYIAAKKLHLESLPCIFINIPEDDMLVFLAINLDQNKNSNIVELSLVLNRLKAKFKYTQKDISSIMRNSRSQIANIMRLVKLPDNVLVDLSNEKMSFGHARVLLTLNEEQLNEALNLIYEHHYSVRDLEKYILLLKHGSISKDDEDSLCKKFGCGVNSTNRNIKFTFKTKEEKEKFIKKLLKKKI